MNLLSETGGKLQTEWLGPYIVKSVGPNNQVELERDGVVLMRKVNVVQLKAYVERSTSDQGIVSLHYIVSNNTIDTAFCVLYSAFIVGGCSSITTFRKDKSILKPA